MCNPIVVDTRAVLEIITTVVTVTAGVVSLKSDVKYIKQALREHLRHDEENFADVRSQLSESRSMIMGQLKNMGKR